LSFPTETSERNPPGFGLVRAETNRLVRFLLGITMKKKSMIISSLTLMVVLFCLSLFYVDNSICCMFSGIRERGFPSKIYVLSKVTDSFEEAQKVYSLSDRELLRQDWKLKLGSIWEPAYITIPINLIFYFVLSCGLIFVYERVKRMHNS
jgi:hypothetical protein